MPRYTDASKDRVRETSRLEEIAGEHTDLRRSGPDKMVGRCPFHDERTGSFTITVSKQLYHCFGCQAGGDIFGFVTAQMNLDFVGALEYLARRANIELELEEETGPQAAWRKKHARQVAVIARAASFYAHHLNGPRGAAARSYLAARGLRPEVLEQFGVGYAPLGPRELLTAAGKSGIEEAELVSAGLALAGRGKGGRQDRFRDRIVFPTSDWRGQVVGFGARRLGEHGAKYVNSPESKGLYSKRELLYGCHQARQRAARERCTVVVEGYTDVLAFHQVDVSNTVATMGTAVTEEQIRLLLRLAPAAIFVLDGDRSGREAALHAGPLAQAAGLDLKIAVLKAELDPADIAVAGGADAVGELLSAAVSFPRFQVDQALANGDLSSAEGKDAVVAHLRPIFAEIPSSAVREDLLHQVADALQFDVALVRSWMEDPASAQEPPPTDTVDDERAEAEERARLQTAVRDRALRATLDPMSFRYDLYRTAAEHLRTHPDDPSSDLSPDDHELAGLLALLMTA